MTIITDLQLGVLRELNDRRNPEWLNTSALAALLEQQPWHIRAALSALRRARLVKRADTIDLAGSYAITPTGIAALYAGDQLGLGA